LPYDRVGTVAAAAVVLAMLGVAVVVLQGLVAKSHDAKH
jgi:hypothetical protein